MIDAAKCGWFLLTVDKDEKMNLGGLCAGELLWSFVG